MKIDKKYIDKRILEMVEENRNLEEKKTTLTIQGQQIQAQHNQVVARMQKLMVELELLESMRGGRKKC